MEYVTANEVVATVQTNLGFDNNQYRIEILQWIYDALMECGVSHHFIKKSCEIGVSNYIFAKPTDYIAAIEVMLYDDDGKCYRPYVDETMPLCKNYSDCDSTIYISQRMKSFELSSNATTVTKAKLLYFSTPIDENDCLPMIPYWARAAVEAYAELKYTIRQRRRNRSRQNIVPMNELQFFQAKWSRERDRALAAAVSPSSFQEVLEVSNAWREANIEFAENMKYHISHAYKSMAS